MGASCWFNYAPYQEDLEQAFQALRQHVFATGEYYQGGDFQLENYPDPPRTLEEAVQRGEETEDGTHSILDITQLVTQVQRYADFISTYVRMTNGAEGLKRPVSSEEERRYYQDYERFVGTALPFSSEDLVHYFRSEKPARAEVEAAIERGEIWSVIPTGIAFYAIVYQNDAPHEIVFIGASGD